MDNTYIDTDSLNAECAKLLLNINLLKVQINRIKVLNSMLMTYWDDSASKIFNNRINDKYLKDISKILTEIEEKYNYLSSISDEYIEFDEENNEANIDV